ncbi:hypothetical protein LCGC14_0730390 [marine sediment metagenome]|uniref:Uncharacterized protein n=1 Tax=marine sediment metagenome TaxID=412755 RepID=A0A0F9SUX5_9ZZZZ
MAALEDLAYAIGASDLPWELKAENLIGLLSQAQAANLIFGVVLGILDYGILSRQITSILAFLWFGIPAGELESGSMG